MNYPFPVVRKTSSLNVFFPRGTEMWNNLPVQIQQSNSVQLFKRIFRAPLTKLPGSPKFLEDMQGL